MTKLNNVDLLVKTNNPEEEMKMTNVNNMVNGVAVEGLNKDEKIMIELQEKREMMMMAIEGELMQEVVDMVQVEEYEELLAGIEWEIIQLLNAYEEQVLEEEYEMEKAVELEAFESRLAKEVNVLSEQREFNSSKISEFVKEKFLEKFNPKVIERRKKRLKVYEEPIDEEPIFKQFPKLDKVEDVVISPSNQKIKMFPMLDKVEDVVDVEVKELPAHIKEARKIISEKYKEISLVLGNKITTEVSYNNGKRAKMNYFYLNGVVVYSEPVNSKIVGKPNLNVPTYGIHPETYSTYVPYAYSRKELYEYYTKRKAGLIRDTTKNSFVELLGKNFGDMCFFESKHSNVSSKELLARKYQKEAEEEGVYAKIEISMVPQEHRKNESFVQFGYGTFLHGELVFFDRVSRYGNTYDRTFMPNYLSLKLI